MEGIVKNQIRIEIRDIKKKKNCTIASIFHVMFRMCHVIYSSFQSWLLKKLSTRSQSAWFVVAYNDGSRNRNSSGCQNVVAADDGCCIGGVWTTLTEEGVVLSRSEICVEGNRRWGVEKRGTREAAAAAAAAAAEWPSRERATNLSRCSRTLFSVMANTFINAFWHTSTRGTDLDESVTAEIVENIITIIIDESHFWYIIVLLKRLLYA